MAEIVFPLRHVSVRVPWHDSGWNGSVCADPRHNTACLKLKSIAASKDEVIEMGMAGRAIRDLPQDQMPPCVKERGTIMADFAFERLHEHPYSRTSPDSHGHFAITPVRYPAFSEAAVPFLWMMRDEVLGNPRKKISGLAKQFLLDDVDLSIEPELGFETIGFQDHRNHRTLLECFWNHVRVEESLVFFYAKQVPLVEDTGRGVLVGVGGVKRIGGLKEYG